MATIMVIPVRTSRMVQPRRPRIAFRGNPVDQAAMTTETTTGQKKTPLGMKGMIPGAVLVEMATVWGPQLRCSAKRRVRR